MSDRQLQAKKLFLELMEYDSQTDRQQFLEEQCSGDEQLRQEVVGLLGHQQQLNDFLEAQPAKTLDIPEPEPDQTDQMIGMYKLREKIGEGGMGYVYLAEQIKPVRRKVALKIIKPGMDTKQVVARFEAERQALAMMSHPNIAKVLDGGTTDQGRPYFVMELVKGIPITAFCDQHQYGLRQRLELFITVCRAVQHAHLKGIIHRDLKPSNVIVELHDVLPVVKVIDFGIAKATNQRLSDQTVYTQFSQMIGTPMYMSPEQAQQSALDVDVRSDVYSLGVLLYELLTGTTPFDKNTLRDLDLLELRKVICEQQPPRPSTRVSTLKNDASSTISTNRKIDPRKLSLSMERELDWVVMRAIEKDRTRRYESASAFAADIQRYLDDESVQACPPSIAYRTRKFAKRHKALLTTGAMVLAAMMTATGVSAWYAVDANAARKLANQRSEQAEADYNRAIKAVDMVVDQLASDEFAKVPGMVAVREKMSQSVMQMFEEIVASHQDDPMVRQRTADAYYRLQFVYRALGLKSQEKEAARKATALYEELLMDSPNNVDFRIKLASAYQHDAWSYSAEVSSAERRQQFEKSVALLTDLDQVGGTAEQIADAKQRIGAALPSIVLSNSALSRVDAERLLHQAIEFSAGNRQYLCDAFRALATVQKKHRDWEAALQSIDQAIECARENAEIRKLDSYPRRQIHKCTIMAAEILEEQGAKQAAKDARREALQIAKQLHAEYPNTVTFEKWVMDGRIWEEDGLEFYLEDALRDARLSILDSLIHRHEADALLIYARKLKREGRDEEAEQMMSDTLPLLGQALVDGLDKVWDHAHYAEMKEILIGRLVADRKFDEAQVLLDSIHFDLGADHVAQAHLHRRCGDHESALDSLNKAIKSSPDVVVFWEDRGTLLASMQRFSEAAADFSSALEIEPTQWHILKRREKARFYAGDYSGALSDLRQVRREAPDDLSALRWIAIRDSVQCPDENYRRGYLELVEQALEDFPDDAGIHFIHAGVSIAQEDYGQGLNDYQTAIELDPSNLLFTYHSALLSLVQHDEQKYGQICKAFFDQPELDRSLSKPERPMAAWMASLNPGALECYDQPIQLARDAIIDDSDALLPHQALGALLFRSGKYDQAIAPLAKANSISADPRGSIAYSEYYLAMVHHQLGNRNEAVAALQRANDLADQELASEDPEIAWNRRLTLEMLRREAEARLRGAD